MRDKRSLYFVLEIFQNENVECGILNNVIKDKKFWKSLLHFVEKNGLYYFFISELKQRQINIPDSENEKFSKEEGKLSVMKKTFLFLNNMTRDIHTPYVLIKYCPMIPHVPRDLDIFVLEQHRDEVLNFFKLQGVKIIYSNEVETSFKRDGLCKIDIYTDLNYAGHTFIDSNFLDKSKVKTEIGGIPVTSLNNEANFLLLLVHSVFGHRSMTLLDFICINSYLKLCDLKKCRNYASEKQWDLIFDLCVDKIQDLEDRVYNKKEDISFPYLFDRTFMVQCMDSFYDKKIPKLIFYNLSLSLDRISFEIANSPFYDIFLSSEFLCRLYNNFGYYIRNRRGDKHGIYSFKKLE